ncbi:MAG: TIGR02452 family protein [Treponema sp.]|nr:TIGR02452 family protein [Treponema sp.]
MIGYINKINQKVFLDTEKLCKENINLVNSIEFSRANQVLITEEQILNPDLKIKDKEATVLVSSNKTFQAAANYKDKKVCVLNFASAINPGGGVRNGATAQEESLCRISTLYFNLIDDEMLNGFYKKHLEAKASNYDFCYNDDLIYTPAVTVFKSDDEKMNLLDERDWYKTDVITCAAPNLFYNYDDSIISASELEKLHIKRGRKILNAAASFGVDVIILGAFGCGAFRNNPKIVARAYASILEEYKYAFETIEFAIYYRPGPSENNYEQFKEIINK